MPSCTCAPPVTLSEGQRAAMVPNGCAQVGSAGGALQCSVPWEGKRVAAAGWWAPFARDAAAGKPRHKARLAVELRGKLQSLVSGRRLGRRQARPPAACVVLASGAAGDALSGWAALGALVAARPR